MEQKLYLKTLYPKLISRTITDEELDWLLKYFDTDNLEDLYQVIAAALEISDEASISPQPSQEELTRSAKIYQQIEKEISQTQSQATGIKLWRGIAAAASVALVLGAGIYFYNHKPSILTNPVVRVNDVAPGKYGATLTLANGRQVRLTDATNGELARESGMRITKTAEGKLVYELLETNADQGNAGKINTLSTAKGETYQLRLPDGSKVWLNAASSISYAVAFNQQKGKRKVVLNGEAYFEVAKDKARPFLVESNGQEVEVLGTHFNINSYADETSIKTTLLEGSVVIRDAGKQQERIRLKPNQQSSYIIGQPIKLTMVDAETAVDWKNSEFIFNSETLTSILRRVSRWYDVEIVYQNNGHNQVTFTGSVSRFAKVSGVLKMLEKTSDAHFEITGKKILVK